MITDLDVLDQAVRSIIRHDDAFLKDCFARKEHHNADWLVWFGVCFVDGIRSEYRRLLDLKERL